MKKRSKCRNAYAFFKNRWLVNRANRKTVRPVDPARFEEILDKHTAQTVFVHAGLRDVKAAFSGDPFRFLMDKLIARYENVLAPGFTPSFRGSGVYHKQFSKPEYGAFSKTFLDEADYRTDDAIHSILVRGDYRFDRCDHHDSFGEKSCFAQLDEDNVLYCNIGTRTWTCTQVHYAERLSRIPYMKPASYPGVIYYDETSHETIDQINNRYDFDLVWNRQKVEDDARAAGVMQTYDLNGLLLRFFNARAFREFLQSKMESDPYYHVVWKPF